MVVANICTYWASDWHDWHEEIETREIKDIEDIETIADQIIGDDKEDALVHRNRSGDQIKLEFDMMYYHQAITISAKEVKDPVYLPMQTFLCFPKTDPGCERWYGEAYSSKEEAESALETLKMRNEYPYLETGKKVFITDRSQLDKTGLRLETLLETYGNTDCWHPTMFFHAKNVILKLMAIYPDCLNHPENYEETKKLIPLMHELYPAGILEIGKER